MDVLERAAEVESKMSGSEDVIRLDFKIAGKSAVIFYIDAMIDKMAFEIGVMKPLKGIEEISMPYEKSFNRVVTSSMPIYVEDFEKAIEKLASSDMMMLVEGSDDSYIISLRSFAMRTPNEPPRETVLKGPREGFVEDIKTNMTLIRRRLKTPDLAFENMTAGKYTKTPISICYIKGIAEEKVIEEVKSRIKEINTDGILDSSYVARYIEERKYSIFNEVGSVEKPDVLTGKLLEGRVGVLVDGSPIVLTVPLVFLEQFQSAEDYYVKSFRATFTRLVRIFAFFLAILLPAGYVALQEFQYQVFPLKVLASLMNTIFGVPLPPTLEMIFVLLIFEILNEAAIRMPKHIGTSLSVVGAIVLGEAAVSAGLLSTPTILVVALSSIGMYTVPDEADSSSILRMSFVIVSGVLGLYGLVISCVALVAYLVSIKGFGTSYLAPFSPSLPADMKDTFIMQNELDMKKRPYTIPTNNRTRKRNNG